MEQKDTGLSHTAEGAAAIAVSALLMSMGGLLIKVIPWSALAVNGGRNLFAALITLLYLRLTHRKLRVSVSVLLCGACMTANAILYTCAVRLTAAANAIVIEYVSPAFVILYLWIFFHQRPRRLDLLACVVVFAGVVCFFLESLGGGGTAGNVLAVAAAATYAMVFLVNRFPGSDGFSSFFFGQLFSAVIGLPWLLREPVQTLSVWGMVAFMGVFQIGVAYVLMCRGLATTSPVTANLICMLEPVCNPLWVALFYGERIGPLALTGMGIVLIGLLVYNVLNTRRAIRK